MSLKRRMYWRYSPGCPAQYSAYSFRLGHGRLGCGWRWVPTRGPGQRHGDGPGRARLPAVREGQARGARPAKNRELWKGSANPERSYTAVLDEDLAFVRFVNPGDLRAASVSCAPCHRKQVGEVQTSPMTHGAMLYGVGSVMGASPRSISCPLWCRRSYHFFEGRSRR